MHNELLTKRSPIVLIWKFAAIEAAGLLLYFVATLFGNAKYELYTQLSFSSLLSYQAAKLLVLYGAQFVFTVYAFLSWYYEEYAVRPGSITHSWGVFFKRTVEFRFDKSASASIKSNFLGKLLHYGAISVQSGASVFIIKTISRPERVAKAISGDYGSMEHAFGKEPDISQLLTEPEHNQLEFKSSLRFDYKTGNSSRELEKAAIKTVAAFLNSKGGYLILGVDDARAPLGLENDYRILQRKDRDGFENHFTQSFNNMIGPEFRNCVKLWFQNIDGRDVCVVQAVPAPRPVYLKADNSEFFYMRTGNISASLKLSEIESYANSRWPKRIS
ncbi:MAG: RNA-binding domain-containing protein [Patescibacteria group bacterium]